MEEVVLDKEIPVKKISDLYKSLYNIDTSNYFDKLEKIQLYRNKQTQLKFYSPANLAGNDSFYENLQNFDWYYIPWKWEHEFVAKIIRNNSSVLEIGAGEGGFLTGLKNRGLIVDSVGLELNKKAVDHGISDSLDLRNQTVQQFAQETSQKFDVVCSFQVMEHIANPNLSDFISAQLTCLKEGGLFVVAVPNNAGFIKYDEQDVLNMPPHHMILWSGKSLTNLKSEYNLSSIKLFYEPLQKYHIDWYHRVWAKKILGAGFVSNLYYKLRLNRISLMLIKTLRSLIKGHTVLAIYEK